MPVPFFLFLVKVEVLLVGCIENHVSVGVKLFTKLDRIHANTYKSECNENEEKDYPYLALT